MPAGRSPAASGRAGPEAGRAAAARVRGRPGSAVIYQGSALHFHFLTAWVPRLGA